MFQSSMLAVNADLPVLRHPSTRVVVAKVGQGAVLCRTDAVDHRRQPWLQEADQVSACGGLRRRAVAGCPGPVRAVAVGIGLFRRWQRDGTWRRMLAALQGRADAAGLITWDVSVDSTVARAHRHAAG